MQNIFILRIVLVLLVQIKQFFYSVSCVRAEHPTTVSAKRNSHNVLSRMSAHCHRTIKAEREDSTNVYAHPTTPPPTSGWVVASDDGAG